MRHRQYGLASQLSGWEQQKVALARALIHNPSFVIADEPTGNLDAKSTRAIADILLDIHADGNTIMLITHDQSLVEYLQWQQTNINLTSLT
jgi:putative ABC transport system ATP-binding protein